MSWDIWDKNKVQVRISFYGEKIGFCTLEIDMNETRANTFYKKIIAFFSGKEPKEGF